MAVGQFLRWTLGGWRTRVLLVMVALSVTAHNRHVELKGRSQYKDITHLLLTMLYLVRKSVSVALKRILGIADHPYWYGHEEVIVRTLAFAAKIGHCTAPRLAIEAYEKAQRGVVRFAGLCHVEDVNLGLSESGRDAVLISLEKETKLGQTPVILFYHGGGYVIGCAGMYVNAHRRWLENMKRDHGVDCVVLSIEYPLAPDTQYPENLHFAARAYDHVVDRLGIDPKRIVLSGDSAGGAMAFYVARHAAQQRSHSVAGLAMVSPWVSHEAESDSHKEHLHTDFVAGKELLRDYSRAYASEHDALQNDHISPVHGDVSFLPPTFVTYGSREVFRNDIEAFIAKVERSDKFLHKVVGEDMPHIYPLMWPLFTDKTAHALSELAHFSAKAVCA